MAKKEITPESVWNEYETACNFKAGLNLYDNVRANENFYIGKQWEGVQSNGLPTPVFNFIKRIILYVVASTATDIVIEPLTIPAPDHRHGVDGGQAIKHPLHDSSSHPITTKALSGFIRIN